MLKSAVLDAIRAFVAHWGYEVRREPSLMAFLAARDVDLAIDVGANEGQFATELRHAGYRGRIVSFEPVSEVFARLRTRASHDPEWLAMHSAVGAENGNAVIHVSKTSLWSSMHELNEWGRTQDVNMTSARREVVPVVRLDDLAELDAGRRIFLKVDTQGFEPQVLAGAPHVLERTVALQLELALESIYEGTWDFREAVDRLDEMGFVPAQFRTVATSADFPASAVEVDCLFRRRKEG